MSLPGDPLTEASVAWSKQMLAASVQQADDVKLRVVNAGKVYPAADGDPQVDALVRGRLARLHLAVRHRR